MKFKVLVSLVMCLLLAPGVSGAEYSYSMNDTGQYVAQDEWDKLIDGLPQDIAGEVEEIDPYEPQNAVEDIKEKTSLGYWIGQIWSELTSVFAGLVPNMIPILAMILLLSASQMILPTVTPDVSSAFMMFGKLTIAVTVFSATFGVVSIAQKYLDSICNLMNLMTPVMQAIYLAEGSVTQMSVSTSAVMLAVTVIGNINTRVMAPCTNVLFTLSAVASVCDEVNLGGVTAAIRRFIMRLWQIVTIGFSFMLGTQSIIARSADTLAAKTVKFALGSMIPMAGGVIAEAYNTVKEGLSFVRVTAGIGGIIMILLILIPGIVPLVVYKISVIFTASAAEMLKLDTAASLLNEVKGIIEIITAIVLYTSLMLIFAIILFTRSLVG